MTTRMMVIDAPAQWPRLIALGTLDAVIGVLALAWPRITVLVLAVLLGIALLMAALLLIGFGWRIRSAGAGWGWWLIGLGIAALLAAALCLAHPGAGVAAIVLAMSAWFALSGIADLMVAAASREHRAWFLVLGALSLIVAVVLLVDIGAAILTIALIVGVSFLLRAAGEIVLGLRLRTALRAASRAQR